MRYTNWRDCKAWRDVGLPLSSTSNQACKLYDAALTQYVSWYEEDSVGGLEKCVGDMLKEDPTFIMGHVMSNNLELMATGTSIHKDPKLHEAVDNMLVMTYKTPGLSPREKLHVKASDLLARGHMREAAETWEEIMEKYPKDMFAIKLAHDAYFYMGSRTKNRDSIERVLPHWKPDMPLYGYLMGMHSFGLVENNQLAEAEKVAAKGLEINPADCWSTHSMAHVLEMTCRPKEGIQFLSSTVKDWSSCGMLACHNFWHWALYHIEKGEYQAALDIFDSECAPRAKASGAMLDIVDVCSLLYRLELEGENVGSRWEDILETCQPHSQDHILAFNDVHVLMCLLGAKKKAAMVSVIDGLAVYLREGEGTNLEVTRDVGGQIMNAFVAYYDGQYDSVITLMKPLKDDIVKIGGSNAQRDLFNLFMIDAALKSPEKEDHQYARELLLERKTQRQNSPMTDRLMACARIAHSD